MEVPFEKIEVHFRNYYKACFVYEAKKDDKTIIVRFYTDDVYRTNMEATEMYYLEADDDVEYDSKTKTFTISTEI